MNRRDELPAKFTAAEREAYQWLYDCGVTGWTVDLLTKRVRTADAEYPSLTDYRSKIEQQPKAGREDE